MEGVIDEDKVEILKQCVVAWCHRPLPLAKLTTEMRAATIQGLTIMRFAGPMALLMFGSSEELVVECNCSAEDGSKAQGTESENELEDSSGQRVRKTDGEVVMDTLGWQNESVMGHDIQISAADGERNVWQENQNLEDAYRHGSSKVEGTLECDIFVKNRKAPATLSSTKGEDTIIPDSLASKQHSWPFGSQHLEIGMVDRAEQVGKGTNIRECESPLDHVQPINEPTENIRPYKVDIMRINETERKV
ncbi:hypothetical protein V6N12_050813 [Hibiscus sabdariffa]|uniref:Uncharacterized protein n=1 Tax=Hibiscus sabdariffa TaxID=183260 RepID=A0ABR2GDG6_9ROSI